MFVRSSLRIYHWELRTKSDIKCSFLYLYNTNIISYVRLGFSFIFNADVIVYNLGLRQVLSSWKRAVSFDGFHLECSLLTHFSVLWDHPIEKMLLRITIADSPGRFLATIETSKTLQFAPLQSAIFRVSRKILLHLKSD